MTDMLSLKPDWDKVMERHKAWWACEPVEGPMLLVWARRTQPAYQVSRPPQPTSYVDRWTDAAWRAGSFEANAVMTHYAGDSFPYFDTNFGPGSYAMFLGSTPEFTADTVWFHRCVADLSSDPLPAYDPSNPWWQRTLDICAEGRRRFAGKALTSFPDLVEGLDILASLAGTTETLMALLDSPSQVHRWLARLDELYFEYYERIESVIKDEWGGTCFAAFSIWGPGRTAKLQCDFSAMISPAMFEEFVGPYLSRQASRLDNVIYHLDGPDCICHVDCLTAIPRIRAIQWTPGAGKESLGDPKWLPLYKRVRAAGKGLVLLGMSPKEAKDLVEELGPEGLYIGCWVNAPGEADALVKDARSWRKR